MLPQPALRSPHAGCCHDSQRFAASPFERAVAPSAAASRHENRQTGSPRFTVAIPHRLLAIGDHALQYFFCTCLGA
jgi:hypothetical protein